VETTEDDAVEVEEVKECVRSRRRAGGTLGWKRDCDAVYWDEEEPAANTGGSGGGGEDFSNVCTVEAKGVVGEIEERARRRRAETLWSLGSVIGGREEPVKGGCGSWPRPEPRSGVG
jgi:hypothetical protein